MFDTSEFNKLIYKSFSQVKPLEKTSLTDCLEKTGAKIVYSHKRPCTFEQFLNSIFIGKKTNKLLFINEIRQNNILNKKFKYDKNGYHKILYQPYFTKNDLNILENIISILSKKYNIILDKNII